MQHTRQPECENFTIFPSAFVDDLAPKARPLLKEGFGGDEEVEPAVFLDGGGEAAGIDEGGADGRAAGKGEDFDFRAAKAKKPNSGPI